MFSDEKTTSHALSTLFTQEELALIWAALIAYRVPVPDDDDDADYDKLEAMREELTGVFE